MRIDWFTFIAQIINFLVLVWLLKRVLFQPILRAVDEREKRIAASLREAEEQKAKAKEEREKFERENESLEQRRGNMLARAAEEAEDERHRLVEKAREESKTQSVLEHETLLKEFETLRIALAGRVQREVFAIARKTLDDLAGIPLEQRAVEVFILRLKAMTDEEKQELLSGLKTPGGRLFLRSAFELGTEQRQRLERAISETLGAGNQMEFAIAPEIVSGIELSSDGHRVCWNIANHLNSLEKSVAELLEKKEEAQSRPSP